MNAMNDKSKHNIYFYTYINVFLLVCNIYKRFIIISNYENQITHIKINIFA